MAGIGLHKFITDIQAQKDHSIVSVWARYGPESDLRDTGGDLPRVCIMIRLVCGSDVVAVKAPNTI